MPINPEGKVIPEAENFLKEEQVKFINDFKIHSSMQGFSEKVKVAKYQAAIQMIAANQIEESVKSLNGTIDKLDRAIINADQSSGALTKAIINITRRGTIIAALSLIVAAASVGLEFYNFFTDS